MPTLILYPSAASEYDYVVLRDDQQVATHGRAVPALLPAAARSTEVVLVLPVRAVSWHQLALPAKVAAGVLSGRAEVERTRAVLSGAMEEQLLDDAATLHFAAFLQPGGSQIWVAVCERAWLQSMLAALEASGRAVNRIVAEGEPQESGTALAMVSAAMQPAQLALCTSSGVSVLPLGEPAVELVRAHTQSLEVLAEPSVMGAAEAALGAPVQAQTLHQSMVRAAGSVRNLAQLEFSPSRSGRARKRMGSAWQTVWHAPQWRPVRWGLVALLVSQIVAINAAAYRQQALLAQKRVGIDSVLSQTFPQVPLIVNAPVQMQRELSALAQSRGASDTDMARLLSAVAQALGNGKTLTAVDMSAAELRVKAAALSEADAVALSAALNAPGWQARLQGDQLVLQRKEAN